MTPAERVQAAEAALAKIPLGIASTTVDGQTTKWDRAAALAELADARRAYAASKQRRPMVRAISLRNTGPL